MSYEILVEVSARHLHLSQEHLEILFGQDAKLTPKKNLSQPGQFACEEKVSVVGPKNTMKMSVLGPVRKSTQVEVSLTDARTLGLTVPIRESGDLAGSAGCKLVGPCGEVELQEGVIVAKRHAHFTPADAEKAGVKNGESVYLKLDTPERRLVLGDVVVRVSETAGTAVHIDTDEANAANLSGCVMGQIVEL